MAQDRNDKYNISGAQFVQPADDFQVMGSPGAVDDPFQRVLPRTAIYVVPADTLLLNVTAEFALFPSINLAYRLLLTDGTVQTFLQAFQITNGNGENTFSVQLPEGWLLSVTVEANTANIPTGAVYAQVFLIRGASGNLVWPTLLLGEYINSFFHIAWPGTPIRIPTEGRGFTQAINPANPGAGNNFSFTFDQRFRWRLDSLAFKFTTSAVVANRSVRLLIGTVALFNMAIPAPGVQAASTTLDYTWGTGLPYGATDATFGFTAPLPANLEWSTASHLPLITSIGNIDVGDTITAVIIRATSWIESD